MTVSEWQDLVDEGQKDCENGDSHRAMAAIHQRGQGQEWTIDWRRSGKLVWVLDRAYYYWH